MKYVRLILEDAIGERIQKIADKEKRRFAPQCEKMIMDQLEHIEDND